MCLQNADFIKVFFVPVGVFTLLRPPHCGEFLSVANTFFSLNVLFFFFLKVFGFFFFFFLMWDDF